MTSCVVWSGRESWAWLYLGGCGTLHMTAREWVWAFPWRNLFLVLPHYCWKQWSSMIEKKNMYTFSLHMFSISHVSAVAPGMGIEMTSFTLIHTPQIYFYTFVISCIIPSRCRSLEKLMYVWWVAWIDG